MKQKKLQRRTVGAALAFTMFLMCTACTPVKQASASSGTENGKDTTVQAAQQAKRKTYGTVTEEKPIVETTYGKIQGRTENGTAGFRNIPYGGTVDGEGRFLPAPEPEKWDDVLDCTVMSTRAVQNVGLSGHGNLFQTRVGDYFAGGRIGEMGLNDMSDTENCLNLNVLTPGIDEKKRPVMVYIHGGAFVEGSNAITAGAYGLPNEEDVVLVGVNHRLNGFGYLYLGGLDEKYKDSGNVGLLDLVQALEWVQKNIGAFGGDPDNVTIFGESGGGAKVISLTMMDDAKGLFHRAIVESGSYHAFKTKEEAAENTKEVLGKLGIAENELDKLSDLSTEELSGAFGGNYGPVVDGIHLTVDPYSAPQSEVLKAVSDVPVLIGTDADEMKWLAGEGDRDLFKLDDNGLEETITATFGDNAKTILEGYRKAYPDYSASDLYFKISTDNLFGKNATYLADLLSQRKNAPVYRYLYNHVCPIENRLYGAYHTAELPLVMRLVMYDEDEIMSQTLADMWSGFARSGNPSTDTVEWPEYTEKQRQTTLLDTECKTVSDPEKEVSELWAAIDGWEKLK